jgi:hypothetical protein
MIDNYPGYRHEISSSLFRLGTTSQKQALSNEDGVRYLGSEGTFVQWANGHCIALPVAGSTSRSAGPLTNVADEHNARVRAYFESRGVPTAQIAGASVSTDMEEGAGPDGGIIHRKFLGYTTVLRRKIEGVRVDDSFAWAQFDKEGSVTMESVWWPALPHGLADEVAAFRRVLDTADLNAALRAKLPPEISSLPGELNIHHAQPHGAAWYAGVTLDFAVAGQPYAWHVAVDGTLVQFVPVGAPPSSPRP